MTLDSSFVFFYAQRCEYILWIPRACVVFVPMDTLESLRPQGVKFCLRASDNSGWPLRRTWIDTLYPSVVGGRWVVANQERGFT